MDGGVREQEMQVLDIENPQDSELKSWAQDIKGEMKNQFCDITDQQQASTSSKRQVAIYLEKSKMSYLSTYWALKIFSHSDGLCWKYPWSDKECWQYVAYMTNWLGLNIDLYLEYMTQNKDLILSYYNKDTIDHYFNEKCGRIRNFLEFLIVGSCFQVSAILLFQNICDGTEILKGSDPARSKQFSILFGKIMNDQIETKDYMLRLELQIPWLAVQAVVLYSNNIRSELLARGTTIDSLAMSCFNDLYPRVNKSKVDGGTRPSGGFQHLLHIFHWTRTPENKWPQAVKPSRRFAEFYIPSATQLLRSSTNFKEIGGGTDVIYKNKRISGLMQISPLHLFQYSNKIFRDLIVFEQTYYLECGMPVTAYLACMSRLLETEEDVKIMQKYGIVQNTLNGAKEASSFVEKMGEYLSQPGTLSDIVNYVPDDLVVLSEKVMEHHQRDLSREYSVLKNQFCPNRWVIISIVGAIGLFILTFIQTVYTLLGYYNTQTVYTIPK